jgi:hypothetical protein
MEEWLSHPAFQGGIALAAAALSWTLAWKFGLE